MTEPGKKQLSPPPGRLYRLYCYLKRGCGWLVFLIETLLLFIIFLAVYLTFQGFPDAVTDRVKAEISQKGLPVSFERLRLSLQRGLVAEQVEILDESGSGTLMLCEEVHVNLDLAGVIHRTDWLQGLGIENGTIYPGAFSILPKKLDRPWLVMSNISSFITFETEAFRMDPFTARLHGLPIRGKGRLIRGGLLDKPSLTVEEKEAEKLGRERVQAVLDKMWPVLEGLQWSDDSAMVFDFDISPANPAVDNVSVEASGKGVQVRGQWFEDWYAGFSLNGRTLTVDEISAGNNQQRARVKGSLDIENKMVEVHAYSALEPSCVLTLLPWDWTESIRDNIEMGRGSLETECWVGPAPLSNAVSFITGWAKIRESVYRDIWVEEGFLSWARSGENLVIDRLKVRCGTGKSQGQLDGRFRANTSTKEWDCSLTTSVDPHVLLPVTPENLVKLVQKFSFPGGNPTVSLELNGVKHPQPELRFDGSFQAKNFSYQGVPGLTTDSGIQYSNKLLRLDPFYVERDEGDVYGWLEVNGLEKMTRFDLKSSIHPQALGQIVSTNIGRLVRGLGVEGSGRWAAKGRSDYGAKTNSHFEVSTRMRDARLWRLYSKDLNLIFSSIGTNLQFHIQDSELYGGSFTGQLTIAQSQPDRAYDLQIGLKDVGFDPMLDLMRKEGGSSIEGKVNGQAVFSGSLKPFQLPGTEGRGNLRVSEGTLFRLPIFGGLSKLLSRIFPGLGFAAQRDLTASFELRDERLYTEDLNISGSVASIAMDGYYHIGQDLDFDVKGQPLGRGLVADVVQLITMPISELLEFKLEGTLEEPEWRAKHWPKELTGFLKEGKDSDE